MLLIHKNQIFKTSKFANPKYIGDPINLIRIFNEKEVDEIMILDIDCSIENKPPNFKLIESIASECDMPLTYAGGITKTNQAVNLISLGLEKIAIGRAAVLTPDLISEISQSVGSQSLAVIANLNWSDTFQKPFLWDQVGKLNFKIPITEFIHNIQLQGLGELILNFVHKDGTRTGYDLPIISNLINLIKCPLTILGGVGQFDHFEEALKKLNTRVGLGAGSYFVYRGKFNAVLPNYVSLKQHNQLDSTFMGKEC